MTILGLVLISSTVFAINNSTLGEYSTPSGIRFSDYTKEGCVSENGDFNEEDQACYHSAENTISIKQNAENKTLVIISVVYGSGNMRDFSGVVTQENKGELLAKEANIDDSGKIESLVEGGCNLEITIQNNTASLKLGRACDLDLERASGAQKKELKPQGL